MTTLARTKKVLIIDDDARNIFALSAVLRAKGFQCLTTQSGRNGFEKIEANPDETGVVLLDMMMPELDGYETMKMIRKGARPDIPIIAVTAQAMTGDRERCLAAGADEYITKPVDVDRLMGLLRNYIG